ncbi:hypothetical protein GH733_011719 [Mirounga leonina]|nr:hypothetical protein GH733_011719 [Mirounga leonina]
MAEAVCDGVAIMVSRRLRWVPVHTHLTEPVHTPQVLTERIRVHCDQLVLFSSSIYDHFPLPWQLRRKLKDQFFFFQLFFSLPWIRCIGSTQHLKRKFGKDYFLEIKMKDPTRVEPLHTEILKLFPQATWQERFIPPDFSSANKETQLQVFLELSKEQELGSFDDQVDTTVRWKLLPQEEA